MHRRPATLAAVLALPALALTLALTAQGQPAADNQTWTVDPVHSSVVFRIKHLDTAYFYATFNDIAGSITTGDEPAFSFTIPVNSINTRHPVRDEHLKKPEFFEAATYPDMTFQSTKVAADGDTYRVTGDLSLHGVTKSIDVEIKKTGEAHHPYAGHVIGFETRFEIKRSDFGMDQMLDMLSDEVRLVVSLEAKADEAAEAAE